MTAEPSTWDHEPGSVGAVGIDVLTVDGEVDVATAPRLRQLLDDVIESGHGRVVVDLSTVGFLDSSGLGALVWGLKKARARGGWVRLVIGQPRVRRVFELTGLDRSFAVYDTVDAARAPEPARAV